MIYVIDYEICAGFLTFFLIVYFLIHKKLPIMVNRIFFSLLIFLEINILLNIFSTVMLMHTDSLSYFVLYTVMIFYYISEVISLNLFFGYVAVLTKINDKLKHLKMFLLSSPSIIFILLVVTTPFTKALVYFDEYKNFIYGNFYVINYLIGLYFVILVYVLMIKYRKTISKSTILPIFSFLSILIIISIIQFIFPKYLFISFINAIGLVIFFLSVQSPRNHIDHRTELFNVSALQTYLDFARRKNKRYSIFAISIESYDHLSCLFGVQSSNKLLVKIADFLMEKYPHYFIFRYNGNKFLLLLPQDKEDLVDLKFIYEDFPTTWEVENLPFTIMTNSLAIKSDVIGSFETFFLLLDHTFSQMRNQSLGLFQTIDEEAINTFMDFEQSSTALALAIEEKTVEVQYQPIYSISEGRIISIEALARIKDQKGGYISPNIFIDIAEKSGLISKLSELVLRNVCHFLKAVDIKSHNISRVSINLSGIQFMQIDFVSKMVDILKQANISSNLIGLEIIESVATSSIIKINEIMNELIALGFSFYLDDYGKGYSNIDCISNLPFEYIKIDKSIIQDYQSNNTVRLFMNGLITLLKESNKQIVVEGVEDINHLEILKQLGVDYVQGFYYSKPLSEQEMIRLIKQKALKF